MARKLEPAKKPEHLIIETALNFSEMFELPTPTQVELRYMPTAVLIERFWWRVPCIGPEQKGFVGRSPSCLPDWNSDYPKEDRLDCMAAICGTLGGRLPWAWGFIAETLHISRGTMYEAQERWLSETLEYRWMMSHLAGDLKHKALRQLVLGHGNRNAHRDKDRQR